MWVRSGEIGGNPNSWHFYADLIYHFYWTEKPRKPDGPASAVSVVDILRTPESATLRSGFLGLSPKSPKPARVRGKSHGWVTCILRFQDPRLAACLCLSPIREPTSHNQWPEKFIHIAEFYTQLTRTKDISYIILKYTFLFVIIEGWEQIIFTHKWMSKVNIPLFYE